jgi:hypothetical protein
MAQIFLSLIIVLAAMAGLGLGQLLGRRRLKGSCGGLAGSGACACDPGPDQETPS